MKVLKLSLAILILSLVITPTYGQFYNTGQDRASIKWLQIDTDQFSLVFPDYATEKATKFAQKLAWAAENVGSDLTDKTTKIDIIMHMESSTSNAMVVWAPKRMETHSFAGQDNYAEDWFEQLALHEYRHVVQIDKLNMGFTKIISVVFGEMGTSVILGAYLPLWYLEGDAVAIETALSSTGRGRMADFNMPLRSQLLEKGNYSYDKASMGSYRNFVPDHYILGYHLVTLGKKNYGKDIWKNAEEFTARNPYYIVPFSHTILKHSGLRKKAFYEKCMEDLKVEWYYEDKEFIFDTLVENENRSFTSYRFGKLLNDSILIALRSGMDDITQFVKININTKKEKKLLTPGYSYFYNISLNDSILYWTERRYHPRWEHVKYQIIMSYDFRSEKRKQLTHRTSYFFPVISPNSKEIACISNLKDGGNSLILLNSTDGSLKKEIPIKEYIKNLSYSDNSEYIYFYKLQQKGYELVELQIETLNERIILPASYNNRNWILSKGDTIFYTDDENGISNIYLLEKSNSISQQISNLPFGVHNISLYKNKILFSSYSANGYQINQLDISTISKIDIAPKRTSLYTSYITDSARNIQTNPPQEQEFEIKKYSKFTHLLNAHSWGPIAVHADNADANLGISIMSQNLLSSLELSAGYEYILNESVGRYYMDISYTGWHPRISLSSSYQDRRSSYTSNSGEIIPYTWNESSIGVDISEGLRLNKGQFSNYIRPTIGLFYQYLGANDDTPQGFPSNQSIASVRYAFYASSYRVRGMRDLNPRWGQSVNFEYRHTPFGDLDFGSIWAIEGRFYFPGIGKHHNIRTYFAYQNKNADTYVYSDLVLFPRGIIHIQSNTLQSYQINYEMPLLYPDLSISSLMYLKRIKTTLFADYAISDYPINDDNGTLISDRTYYRSIGLDLRFDMHLLRTIAPLDLGVRSAYLPDNDELYFQFLFSINL